MLEIVVEKFLNIASAGLLKKCGRLASVAFNVRFGTEEQCISGLAHLEKKIDVKSRRNGCFWIAPFGNEACARIIFITPSPVVAPERHHPFAVGLVPTKQPTYIPPQ